MLKICDRCKPLTKRSAWRIVRFLTLWTCRKCEAQCCEHLCSYKKGTAAHLRRMPHQTLTG